MTAKEHEARAMLSVIMAAATPGLAIGLNLVPISKPEAIAGFIDLLHKTADALQEQLDKLTASEIDDVIERSKRK